MCGLGRSPIWWRAAIRPATKAASAPPGRRDRYQPVGLKAGYLRMGLTAPVATRPGPGPAEPRTRATARRHDQQNGGTGTAATATPSNGLDHETRGAG